MQSLLLDRMFLLRMCQCLNGIFLLSGCLLDSMFQQMNQPHMFTHGVDPGFVLDAKTQLAMDVSLVVWIQFGILNASDVLLATNPYQSMSLLCMMISHTTNPATKSFFIRNAMFATTLFQPIEMASLPPGDSNERTHETLPGSRTPTSQA